jgi:glutamate 5-kinase
MALEKMNLERRPKHLPQVQALAAIGQCRLIALWDQLFERLRQPVAQILLTRNDIADRTQYLNAQNTLVELLAMGVIPIVNENDTVSVSEIVDKFGDNDTLSAITAGMVGADYLFLMTDVDCLYDKNPRKDPDAKPIEVVEDIAALDVDVSSSGSSLGTGGMSTKIVAAKLATAAGVTTVITKSTKPSNIYSIVQYAEALKASRRQSTTDLTQATEGPGTNGVTLPPHPPLHTRFLPSNHPIRDRHFWLLHGLAPHGTLYVDRGAATALHNNRAGLLPVGIVEVDGNFAQQECVRIVEVTRRKTSSNTSDVAPAVQHHHLPAMPLSRSASSFGTMNIAHPKFEGPATEIGRAIVNYSAIEIRLIAGHRSVDISHILGYADSEYVAIRENVALIDRGERTRPTTPIATASSNLGVGQSPLTTTSDVAS